MCCFGHLTIKFLYLNVNRRMDHEFIKSNEIHTQGYHLLHMGTPNYPGLCPGQQGELVYALP